MDEIIKGLREAAERMGVTRAALYLAIKKGRLKTIVKGCRHYVHMKDIENYKAFKYSREFTKDEKGNLIYNHSKGLYSPPQMAKELGISAQKIYYWIRQGYIRTKRIGAKHVLHIDDVRPFCEKYLKEI